MSDSKRTISFVGAAVVSVVLAFITYMATQPAKSDGFEMVGKEFYADFQSSSQASQLEVYAVDPDSAELKQFRVEEKDGVWTIPSHYGYPAEASDRLAKTSSSLIGISRETLVGRNKADHERYGVLDPLAEDNLDPEATGKRITLKDDSGDVLVDLIIGKAADDLDATESQIAFGQESETTDYYVRHPDETQTYKAALNLDISTKFSDWIRPDLLDLEGAEMRRVVIDNYTLEEQADPLGRGVRLVKTNGDLMQFDRDSGFGPWSMESLPESQQIDSTKLNDAVRTLDNLRIVGVRKKTDYNGQQLLNADLTFNEIDELKNNPTLYRQLIAELADNGFNLTPVEQNSEKLMIVSAAGEMKAGRGDGVVYTMHFGNPVSGDEEEIEIGTDGSNENEDAETLDDKPESDAQPAAEDGETTEEEKEDILNRFLMIRVSFDETLLGEKPSEPTAPVEPVKPEGYVPAADPKKPGTENKTETSDEDGAQDPADSESDTDDESDTDGESESDNEPDADGEKEKEEPADDRPEEFKEYDRLLEEFMQGKAQYEIQLTQFETATKEFAEKVAEGEKLVNELNERFGKWFYVISADNLESIQLTKADLISDKPKVEPETQPPGGLPARPNINLDNELPLIPQQEPAADAPKATSETEGTEPAETPESAGGKLTGRLSLPPKHSGSQIQSTTDS